MNNFGRSPRVLVADDDDAIRTLITTILTRIGFEVEAVRNGAEAIQKIGGSSYAAILLDLMMPVASGFEVITYLKRTAPRRLKTRLIVLTALSNTELRKLDGEQVYRVIRKPFDLDELVSAVVECADGGNLEPAGADVTAA